MMFRVPWITLVLFTLVCISPIGQEVWRSLHSGEQLARSMAQIVLIIYLPVAGLAMLAKTIIRILILRRRRNEMTKTRAAQTET